MRRAWWFLNVGSYDAFWKIVASSKLMLASSRCKVICGWSYPISLHHWSLDNISLDDIELCWIGREHLQDPLYSVAKTCKDHDFQLRFFLPYWQMSYTFTFSRVPGCHRRCINRHLWTARWATCLHPSRSGRRRRRLPAPLRCAWATLGPLVGWFQHISTIQNWGLINLTHSKCITFG